MKYDLINGPRKIWFGLDRVTIFTTYLFVDINFFKLFFTKSITILFIYLMNLGYSENSKYGTNICLSNFNKKLCLRLNLVVCD